MWNIKHILVIGLVGLVGVSVGQVEELGQCNVNIPVQDNFNINLYLGTWYRIESYPSRFQSGTCGAATYSLQQTGGVALVNQEVRSEQLYTRSGTATLTANNNAKWVVSFGVAGETNDYWVLRTDYTDYALVYSCQNINATYRAVSSWKLGRQTTLNAASITAINTLVSQTEGLSQEYYEQTSHTANDCFYYPVFDQLPSTIELPGSCDTSIRGIPNFNANSFLGTWIEIERYPQRFQTGVCNRASYSLSGSLVIVRNTQVINEALAEREGNATAAVDGTGLLNVNFYVNGASVTSNLYVLATDYSNYALLYSCRNLDNGWREVSSWKMSRNTVLTDVANSAINTIISQTQGLSQQYYQTTGQTENDCFYYPEFDELPSTIELPGSCDASIRGIPNFNANAFLGTWIEIQRYPQQFQSGVCNRANYALSGSAIVVRNTQVINEALAEREGSATVAADGTGVLTVYFDNVGGVNVNSSLYVLATDYNNYALLYGCRNLDNGRREVSSWKMSRNTVLTDVANSAINTIIGQTQGLSQQYYQTTGQTENDCFYYPEFAELPSTIELPGSCDASIRGIPNFNANAFLGAWIEIQRYPQQFQAGVCNRANYALSGGAIVVRNTQVINESLAEREGSATVAADGTGVLTVYFDNVGGVNVNSSLYVLATDYNNYALLYGCRNLDNGWREVSSWKMSRNTVLTDVANSAINTVISQTQGLSQQYYQTTGQTENDCFYYPEFDELPSTIELPGSCDASIRGIPNFNANSFLGTWIEIERYPQRFQTGVCNRANYTLSGGTIVVRNTQVINESLAEREGSAIVAADGTGVLTVYFDNVGGENVNTNLYVLATDYTNYALLYGCRNLDNGWREVSSWKMSRSTTLGNQAMNAMAAVISQTQGLSQQYYQSTGQTAYDCYYPIPEFEEFPPIIELMGSCDDSIRGISNFNANSFLGRWIEIERYPQRFQAGVCNRANYALSGGAIIVRNAQVINGTLAEREGNATVAQDGTGVLTVNFIVNGEDVSSNIYVLATDYTSYALLFSCRNIANGYREVSSWIFSRSTSLDVAGLNVINRIIHETLDLRPQFYQLTSQSDDDCFYIPEVDVNAAPLFSGQCDENIVGVPAFNPQQFAGWWHEIERYPVDNNPGECISSEYQTSGNTYQVVDKAVANGTAQTSTGTVEVSTNGRLRRTINGTVQDIWVLATDYDSYALLYSCVNVNSEYRRVWSAKHSKARSLTSAAQTAMAPVIAANRVLSQEFYQQVDHSPAACFYYPDVTGQQVILPGQCDNNIPVVQLFNLEAYEGTWYQIERYPQNYEAPNSSCTGARYTINEGGPVTVLNWEVVDGVLMTLEGSATVSSNDGSAKLSVTLPVVGSTTGETSTKPLYVLTTDYSTYSLVYSCSNVDSFHRSIGAWKLSRTRSLSAASNAAINAYVATRQELFQPYFIEVDQNDRCEEPSSGTWLRSSVIVMMICALWQALA